MTTPRTRVLIVDDEPLARERIRTLLQDEAEFEIVGEAGDGMRAESHAGSRNCISGRAEPGATGST